MSKLSELLRALIDGTEVEIVPTTKAQTYLVACINGTGSEGLPEPTTVLGGLLCELADKLAGGGGGGSAFKILEIDDNGYITKVRVSLKSIPDYFFYAGYQNAINLTECDIAEGVEEIGSQCFYYQKQLSSLTFPSTLKSIGTQAFVGNNNLTEVRFKGYPDAVHNYAFVNATKIKNVYVTWSEGEHSDFNSKFVNSPTFHYNWTPEE